MSDTYARSLEHWSETGRQEMEGFYALASVDYRHLAEANDWRGWFEAEQSRVGDRALRLLDVACGSGKFPVALERHAGVAQANIQPVDYALLDPAAFSIAETRRVLPKPFVSGAEHEVPLQALQIPDPKFDIVWATHALYAVPPSELGPALKRFVDAIAPGGVGFIAHSRDAGHYIQFYRRFLDAHRGGEGTQYSTAEEIEETLASIGVAFESQDITYTNGAPESERAVIEHYLQRCVFDDTVTLDQLRATAETGSYLETCLTNGTWSFPQSVAMITLRAP